MSEPPTKLQRTLLDLFSGTQVQNDGTPSPNSVTLTMSDNSISAIATGEGVTSSVNCSPTIVLQNDPSQRQGNDHETGFLSDIAQSTADEPSQPLLAHFPTTVVLDHVKCYGFEPIHGSSTQFRRTVVTAILVVYSTGSLLILYLIILLVTVIGNMHTEVRALCVYMPLQNHIPVRWLCGSNFA